MFDPTCEACGHEQNGGHARVAHSLTCQRAREAQADAARARVRAEQLTAPAAQTEALAIFLAAEPTDGAAPAAPKKPLALKPLLTPKSKKCATKAMPKFKAKADAAEHDTVDWGVGTVREGAKEGLKVVYFSPGGRLYNTVNKALARMDEGPRLPTRARR